MEKIKKAIFNIIRDDDKNHLAGNIFDTVIITIIIINVLLVILDTFILPVWLQNVSNTIELISVIVFSVEYLSRVWTATYLYPKERPYRARLKYIASFMAIIDLLAILPYYIPFIISMDLRVLRALRVIRLLRLFKLNRYSDALSTIADVFKSKASQLISSVFIVSLLMVIASVLMFNVENEAQPDKFSNAFSGLWWAVATLTTVGYGDIYPVTALGRLFSGIISVLGIGLLAVPTGIISAGFIESIGRHKDESASHPVNPVEDLVRLKQLLDDGVITASEYKEVKARLLKRIR